MPQTGTQTDIKVKPLSVSPTYNETIVVLDSPSKQSNNFKWLVNIYKGESTDTDYELISSLVILPNPQGYGVIDFHRHIENYISTSFFPSDIDKVSSKVTNEGLKWSYEITEKADNIKWRFEDNYTSVGSFVGFTSSIYKHPYVVGDVINITQDTGATHSAYDGQATITTIVDEYTILTDKTYLGSTPVEGGQSELEDKTSREIEQVLTASDNVLYSFNGALSFQDFRTWDSSEYELTNTSLNTTKFLSTQKEIDITVNDRVWINSLLGSAPFGLLEIETDNGIYLVGQTHTPTGQHFINQNKIGYKDILESLDTFTSIGNPLPPVDVNTTFIKITPKNSTGSTVVGETITLNIKDYCSKHEAVRFFYMGKFGEYLPLTFDRVSKRNINNTRSNYKQNYGSYDSVANAWGYTTYDKGLTTYDISSKEVITCTSDWLSESQVSMVVDMLNSPNVYIQDSNNNYVSVNITTNSYEVKKKVNEKLLNYTLSFEYSNTNTNQRG